MSHAVDRPTVESVLVKLLPSQGFAEDVFEFQLHLEFPTWIALFVVKEEVMATVGVAVVHPSGDKFFSLFAKERETLGHRLVRKPDEDSVSSEVYVAQTDVTDFAESHSRLLSYAYLTTQA